MTNSDAGSSLRLLPFLCLGALLAGCDKLPAIGALSGPVDAGSLTESSYQSDFFDFTISFPSQWHALSGEDIREINETAMQVMAEDDPAFHREMQASADRTYYLAALFRDPIEAARGFNPNIVLTAEDIGGERVRTGEDYMRMARQKLQNIGEALKLGDEIRTGSFGGKEFHALSGSMTIGGMRINQFYYATIINDHALVFTLSYSDSTQFAAMQNVLHSITFD